MRKRRWLPKSPPKTNAISPANRRLLSSTQKKHKREVMKLKKLEYNSQRREQRTREELKESQARIEEVVEAAEEQNRVQREEWRREKDDMKKSLARLSARNRREPSKIQHAVQKALKQAGDPDPVQPSIRYVKNKRGVVQDWARNMIVTLVNEGIPITKTWSVAKANAKALGVTIVGKWSFRTSRRVVREGGIAAGLMIIEYVLACAGQWKIGGRLRLFTHHL